MPSKSTYKEARVCECGYVTMHSGNWSTHKRSCKSIPDEKDARIASLERENEHYQKELAAKDEQLAAKDEQLAEKDKILNHLIESASNEIRSLRKSQAAKNRRTKMPEPKRRKIAARQDWKCANPDGNCTLKGELQEYDIDHVIPLMAGGPDNESNMQALCPACHRRKTENDNHIKISNGENEENGKNLLSSYT